MIAQHLTSGCFRDANWDRGSGTASIEDEKSVTILDVVLRDALDVGTRATPASKLTFMASPLIITPLGGQTDVHYARYPTILSPGHGDIPLIRSASALGCKLSLKVAGSEQTSNMNVSTQLYGV
ncbi:hypothetical protein COCCADRAFT_33237 [Bipolaris zeicola 26-R-13]|uniref:Uncharacterized protein n=1 Tax=Cochliobolus carbonum (strain 26-R-13) TaxID=930089 RepID=W6YDA9_COCC2|nr:uncharacterized protein COCCADRAFT_33237 [Bipolaris zeicola 26-R-13]EUC37507.1 hypothetical protein COCCADRAFT_33237 [Bipolaris zeicola 26-R-13]